MSKKAFLRAMELTRAAELDGAVAALENVEWSFIAGRLRHYQEQPDHRETSRRLKDALEQAGRRLDGGNLRATTERPELTGSGPEAARGFTSPLSPLQVHHAPREAITFDSPIDFLTWCASNWGQQPALDLNELMFCDVWALAALACLTFPERTRRPRVVHEGAGPVVRFAHAVGMQAIAGGGAPTLHEPSRTVKLTRVMKREEIERTAQRMSELLISGEENRDARLAARYVLVELLRNVVQHSQDPLGAVAAAQRMGTDQRRRRPMIQLVVADAGIGIPSHLQRKHPHITDYRQALERALLPHISGTFEEGLTGSFENAGLGLYMITELARQTRGSLLIATTGAALVVTPESPSPRFLGPLGIGFPGTLVAVELPSDEIQDYESLMKSVLQKAEERTPKRATDRWLSFSPAEAGAVRIAVESAREETLAAAAIATEQIMPAIVQKRPVELDFTGLDLCTQSWLHALLYEPVRVAWALRAPIHIVGAQPAVQEGLRFLEAYALGG